MKNSKALAATVVMTLLLAISTMAITGSSANAAHVLPVGLGTAAPFAILAGTPNITNVPTSRITGNVGLSPATGAGIGLTCAEVTGTIYSVDAAGPLCRVTDPGLLGLAKNALNAAIVDAAGRSGGLPVTANQLAAKNLPHGVYKSAAAMDLSVGETLILDGGGDPNAVFIFQLGTLLSVGTSSRVSLINQAQSCNVFWQVDSATIGATAAFVGTILAATSITVANGSTVDGRLLAGTGNVTLISDTITKSTCAAPPAPPPSMPPCAWTTNLPFVPCVPTPVTTASGSPSAVATATPTLASVTATPTGVATPTAPPSVAPAATPTAARAAAGLSTLPSTSTGDPSGPLMMLGIGLTGLALFLLRRPVRHL